MKNFNLRSFEIDYRWIVEPLTTLKQYMQKKSQNGFGVMAYSRGKAFYQSFEEWSSLIPWFVVIWVMNEDSCPASSLENPVCTLFSHPHSLLALSLIPGIWTQ